MSLTKSAYWDYITSEEYEQDQQPSNYCEALLRSQALLRVEAQKNLGAVQAVQATTTAPKPSRTVLDAFKHQGWYEGSQAVRKRLTERFKRNKPTATT